MYTKGPLILWELGAWYESTDVMEGQPSTIELDTFWTKLGY